MVDLNAFRCSSTLKNFECPQCGAFFWGPLWGPVLRHQARSADVEERGEARGRPREEDKCQRRKRKHGRGGHGAKGGRMTDLRQHLWFNVRGHLKRSPGSVRFLTLTIGLTFYSGYRQHRKFEVGQRLAALNRRRSPTC